jgi:hypothetical protein
MEVKMDKNKIERYLETSFKILNSTGECKHNNILCSDCPLDDPSHEFLTTDCFQKDVTSQIKQFLRSIIKKSDESTLKSNMNKGEVKFAERKAMELFDKWNDVTCIFTPGTSYYGEIEACIIDAVHCGIQMALNNKINIKNGNVIKGDLL